MKKKKLKEVLWVQLVLRKNMTHKYSECVCVEETWEKNQSSKERIALYEEGPG